MIFQLLIAPKSFSGALSYISYLFTFVFGLYNLVCAIITSVIIFYLVDFFYGTSGMWSSFSKLFLKVMKTKMRTTTNNELLRHGIVPDISQAPRQGAKIHREGLYKDKKNNGMMAVYNVSCTVYAPLTAEHPSIAFVDEEYGEDIDGKFVSKGVKNGVHQIQFKLDLKDVHGEPLDDYHHVNTLDMVQYRRHPQFIDTDSMEDIDRSEVDLSPDRSSGSSGRTLRSSKKKARSHYNY
jgi:hypothetical protein